MDDRDLSLEEARHLAGNRGRVFGDKNVFLYDWRWWPQDGYEIWIEELLRAGHPVTELAFYPNFIRGRYEALTNAGHLGGWPYYVCVAWLSMDFGQRRRESKSDPSVEQ